MEWKTVKLGEICKIFTGKKDVNQTIKDGLHPFFSCAPTPYRSNDFIYDGNVILVAGNGSFTGRVSYYSGKFDLYQRTYACVPIIDDIDFIYLYFYMKALFEPQYMGGTRGSSIPYIVRGDLSNFEISLPPLETQRRIAVILSSLDDKIENNNRINANLEAQAQALFKSWFVDFEPWGGVMPEDWKKGNLLDVADLFDHKRIPLSGMQRDRMEKIYPYYGATSVMDYVDNYLYDGIYLLMGEDGSVMTDEGFPFLQYVEGKFWCNNHAHIMQGKNGYTTEMLYCLLNRTNVSGIVTGAVQGKISQASMKKIPVVLPPAKVCADMSGKLAPYFDEIRSLRQESQRLAALRDTLLPKLMRGEITL